MAAVAALSSPVTTPSALPSPTWGSAGSRAGDRLLLLRNPHSGASSKSHAAGRVTCAANSERRLDASFVEAVRSRAMATLSSVLLASTVISGNVPASAFAYEFDLSSDRPLMAVVDETVDRDTYITMLQNLKTEQTAPEPLTPEDRARLFKENLEKKKRETEARLEEEKRKLEEAQKAEAEANAKRQAEAAASKAKKEEEARARSSAPAPQSNKISEASKPAPSNSRGFMPLFLSQFSLLLAFAGVVSAILFVPESKIKEIEEKIKDVVAKVSPIVEETVEKVKPVAQETLSKTEKFIEEAKPVVEKAIEESKPVIAKAIEQTKPLLEKGQQKAAELFQQSKKSE